MSKTQKLRKKNKNPSKFDNSRAFYLIRFDFDGNKTSKDQNRKQTNKSFQCESVNANASDKCISALTDEIREHSQNK